MRIRFVSPAGGSAFMHELLGVVAYEISTLGVSTTLSEGVFPDDNSDDVYVVVPHEYFAVTPRRWCPTAQQMQRTVAFCVEHPGNQTFETSARWAAALGGVVDINDDSTSALRDRGIAAERFVLGYSAAWDVWRGDDGVKRDIDVTYLGTAEPRRSRVLTSYAETLAPYTVRLLIPPWRERLTKARPDFLMGSAKYEWLRRSRVLLNLHRGQSHSLEWVRVLEALCNGCVVVSEHSIDYQPLVPGRHLVFGHWRNLGQLIDTLLSQPDRMSELRAEAYDLLTTELTMRPSAERLVDLATDLLSSRRPRAPASGGSRPSFPAVLAATESAGEVYGRAPTPPTPMSFRPTLARSFWSWPRGAKPQLSRRPARAKASVDVLVALGSGDPSPVRIVTSVLGQVDSDATVRIAADDTKTDALRSAFVGNHRVVITSDPPPGVVGARRNALLAAADADYILVLEPTDTLLPGALAQLVERLTASPKLAVCYPLTAEPDGEIGNAHPFEPERLVNHDYLGAPSLWRRDALIELGGWCDEPEFASLENYDLWRRLAASDGEADLVPQVLVRRRYPPVALLRPADIDPERFAARLRRRSDDVANAASPRSR